MMEISFLEALIEKCSERGCSNVEASLQKGFSVRVGLEQDNIITYFIEHNFIHLRTMLDGKLGCVTISASKNLSLDAIADITVSSAIANPYRYRKAQYFFTNRTLPFDVDKEKKIMYSDFDNNDLLINAWIAWIKTEAKKISQNFKCQLLSLLFTYEFEEFVFLNSNGTKGRYSLNNSHVGGAVQLNLSTRQQIVSFSFNGLKYGDKIFEILDEQNFSDRLRYHSATQFEELKGRVKFSKIASAQLISSIAQAFNGELAVINNSFLKKEDIGKKIWNDNINIIDDPIAKEGKLFIPFDNEGMPASRKFLVSQGVPREFLCDILTQMKLGDGSPGNGYRKPPDYLIRIYPSNLILEVNGDIEEDYDLYVGELGYQTVFNASSGLLNGVVFGYKINSSGKVPVMFHLGIHINQIFSKILPASSPEWIGTNFVPEFLAIIR